MLAVQKGWCSISTSQRHRSVHHLALGMGMVALNVAEICCLSILCRRVLRVLKLRNRLVDHDICDIPAHRETRFGQGDMRSDHTRSGLGGQSLLESIYAVLMQSL